MKFAELTPVVIALIKERRYDSILEKHEGPGRWRSELEHGHPEFLHAAGHWVLLPIEREHHANVTILRVIESKEGDALTIFLKNTTYTQPGDEFFSAGFLAVCEKMPEQPFFIASVYHEWFIIGRGEADCRESSSR